MFNFLAQAAPVLGKVQKAAANNEPVSASMLADAIPPEQRAQLGEQLLPMVKNVCPDMAEKVTDLLMKLSNSEILKMMGSPDFLKSKVDWAVSVLKGTGAAPDAVAPDAAAATEAAAGVPSVPAAEVPATVQ